MQLRVSQAISALAVGAVIALGAVAATSMPARADNRDVARILGGVVALYAIGRAIELSRDSRARAETAHVPHPPAPIQATPPARVAPARCFVEGHDRSGYVRGYGQRCMQRHAAYPGDLPQACLTHIQTERGPRAIYAGRCLANHGWVREAGFRP